jgi:methyl-accepting chemotaxis protein
MFSNLSIKSKLLIISLVAIVLVSVLVATQSIYSIKKLSTNEIENFKKEAYDNKEKELKNYVSLAMKTVSSFYERTSLEKAKVEVQEDLKAQTNFIFSIVESEYKKHKDVLSENELKDRIKGIIEGTRYGKNGYFWVNDTNAVMVMHPIKPALNGKDLDTYKDKGGKRIFHEFAGVAKSNGEGFVDYVWPKPGFDKPQTKVSYVKLFKPYNWVIGTGEYVSDLSASLKKEALDSISNMRYGKSGYFWINDSNHVVKMHPIKPSLAGKSLYDLKDPDGVYLYRDIVKTANKDPQGGLVKYKWSKPGKDAPQPKFSYVQRFGQWDWIIGTGAYVDDIEENIQLMKEHTEEEISQIITFIALFTLISILIIYIIYTFLIKRTIINPLDNLIEAIDDVASDNSNNKEIVKKSDDEIGKVVDSFNAYIKKLQDGYEEDAKVIAEVEDVIQKVNNGFYVYSVDQQSSNPLVQKLKDSINSMIGGTNEKLQEINKILIEYGNSNFDYNSTGASHNTSNGIVGSIFTSTNQLGGTVSEFLAMITTSGDKLNQDTGILSSSSSKLSASANEQAASLEETAAAVEEITSIIKSSNEKVDRMSILANELNQSAKDGEEQASRTTKAMEDIDKQVNSINDAITVIDQIAFQTNILSLNAAVEAATAGEAGKGFAVVAQEVRNLASRSAEAAKEIKVIVENATTKANEGKLIADNMIGGYTDLNSKISETIELITDVTSASKEQETGIVQINDAINSLDQATQVNASSASQISTLADEVSDLSHDLLSIADRAKFKENKKTEICDIDLVFQISRLKNDHISFKNDNFSKVGSNTTWSVTSCKDCDFGKWIVEQESQSKSYTKTSNWSSMKECHSDVHNTVQEYINKNAQNASNAELESISKKLEDSTTCLFKTMDNIKVDHCKTYGNTNKKEKESVSVDTSKRIEPVKSIERKVDISRSVTKKREVVRDTPSKTTARTVTPRKTAPITTRPKRIEPVKPVSSVQTINANNGDDDEWESF